MTGGAVTELFHIYLQWLGNYLNTTLFCYKYIEKNDKTVTNIKRTKREIDKKWIKTK